MKLFAAAVMCLLCSCAAVSNNAIMMKAGEPPPPDVAEEAIQAHLAATLKDPDSVKQFTIEEAFKRTFPRGYINGGGYDEGWLVCFTYNAKNSFGAYVGMRRSGLMFRQSGSSWTVVPGAWDLMPGYCN